MIVHKGLEAVGFVAASGGVIALVRMQPAAQASPGDVVINLAILLGLIATIVGSLAAAVSFLFKSLSDAHSKTIVEIKVAHEREIAAKDEVIKSINEANTRLSSRVEALLNTLDTKEQAVLNLATSVIDSNKDAMYSLKIEVEQQTEMLRTAVEGHGRDHRNMSAVMMVIATKLGATVMIGDDIGDPSPPDTATDIIVRPRR